MTSVLREIEVSPSLTVSRSSEMLRHVASNLTYPDVSKEPTALIFKDWYVQHLPTPTLADEGARYLEIS